MAGILEGLQYVQRQGELGRQRGTQSRLGRLVSQAYGAPSDQRDAAIQQVVAVDPETGFKLGKGLGEFDQQKMQEVAREAALFTALPEDQKAAAYPQLAEHARSRGIPVAQEWNANYGPMISKLAEVYGGRGAGADGVQSTFVDQSGNRVAVLRNGTTQVLGQAENRFQLRDQPGLPPGAFNTRNGTIRSVQEAGQQNDGAFTIDPSLPPQVQAAIRSNEVQWANAPDGASATIPSSGAAAARPAVDPAEMARLQLAARADQRSSDAANRASLDSERGNAPPGFRFSSDGRSLEPIPGGPKPAGAAASEDERKAASWLAQSTNAYNNMKSALDEDQEADAPGIIESYLPIEEIANRSRSDARQKYVQASESFGEAVLRAATGAGVNRDEALQKVRELTPRRGESEAVKKQKFDSLSVYLDSLRQRAGRAAPQGGQSGRLKYNPATGKIE